MLGFMKESRRMAFVTKSIRTKMLLLVVGITLVVGVASVGYDVAVGETAIREELVKTMDEWIQSVLGGMM